MILINTRVFSNLKTARKRLKEERNFKTIINELI